LYDYFALDLVESLANAGAVTSEISCPADFVSGKLLPLLTLLILLITPLY